MSRFGSLVVSLAVVIGIGLGPVVPAAHAAPVAVAVSDKYTTEYETRLDVDAPGVLGNDLNIGSGRAQLVNDVDDGNLTLRDDGSFQYDPDDGFHGADAFKYRVTGVVSTTATVTIVVKGPTPTPTPAPTPTPMPTPTPTPKPKPKPTPTPVPTPTPTPTPTLLPTLPPLPTLLPTPTPSPTPTRPPGVTEPPTTPTPSPRPPSAAGPGPSELPPPGGSAGPGVAPAGPVETPSGSDPSGGGAGPVGPASTPAIQVAGPAGTEINLTLGEIGGLGMAVEWLVPSIVVTVPGILIILAVLAQGAGAVIWLPYVRRTLGGDRRRRATAGAAR